MGGYQGITKCTGTLHNWCGHLGMDVVVVVDEVFVGHALFLLNEDGHLDDLAEASRVGIPSFEHHDGTVKVLCREAGNGAGTLAADGGMQGRQGDHPH